MTAEIIIVCMTAIACYAMRLLFQERQCEHERALRAAFAEKVDADGRAHRIEAEVAKLRDDVGRLQGAANKGAFAGRS